MKVFCPQQRFNQYLGLVSRAVASRPSQPILANILLEALLDEEGVGSLRLTGYDLELGIVCQFPALVE